MGVLFQSFAQWAVFSVMTSCIGADSPEQENADKGSSKDGALQWAAVEQVPKAALQGVFFLNEDKGWAVGAAGQIATSSDGGRIWKNVKGMKGNEFWRGVWFLTSEQGFIVGGRASPEEAIPPRIAVTRDAGQTWSDITPGLTPDNEWSEFSRIQFVSPSEGFIFGSRLLATKDGGVTWSFVGGEQVVSAKSMFSTKSVGWSLLDENLWKSTDGGETWKLTGALSALTAGGDHGPLTGLHFRSDMVGWVSSVGGRLLRTEDGGLSWKVLEGLRVGTIKAITFTDLTNGWAITELDKTWFLMRTTDGGRNWQESYKSTKRLTGLFFLRKDLGWAVGDSTVLRYAPGH